MGLNEPVPGAIRYQLLHRAASAIIEAKRFGAPHAIMLVHSFSQTHEWFADYAAFAKLLGVEGQSIASSPLACVMVSCCTWAGCVAMPGILADSASQIEKGEIEVSGLHID